MLMLFATLLIGSWMPSAQPSVDQISTRRAHFNLDPGIKPADQLTCRVNPAACGCLPIGCGY